MDAFDLRIRNRFQSVQYREDDLHAYQRTAIDFLRTHPFSALLIDMGLGKTVSTLTIISELLLDFYANKVLVIAPLRVAIDTWPNEISYWQHTAWMNHVVIRGENEDERKVKARSPASIHIINREMVEWLVYFWGPKWPYRVVIIDESSSFKDHSSHRFKALAKVRNTTGLIERLHCLTATPAAESYIHLFPQMYLIDRGQRLGKNITAYRDRYFVYNKYSMKYKLRPGAEDDILEKIADVCLVMKAKDHLNKVDPTVILHKVKLDDSDLKLIRELEAEFIIKLPNEVEIEAKTAAMLSGMVLQMASGSVYETKLIGDWETEDLKKVKKVHHLHGHKIEVLKEIYADMRIQGKPLIVAYHFQSSLAKLKKAFPKAIQMDKDGACIKPWNAGKIPMLLIHPQSAGHGLNLQHGGHVIVFFDMIWSLENYLQTIGRIDRQGQKNHVIVKMLVAEGTRDELVAKALKDKQDAQEKLFRILQRLIRKLRAERARSVVDEVL